MLQNSHLHSTKRFPWYYERDLADASPRPVPQYKSVIHLGVGLKIHNDNKYNRMRQHEKMLVASVSLCMGHAYWRRKPLPAPHTHSHGPRMRTECEFRSRANLTLNLRVDSEYHSSRPRTSFKLSAEVYPPSAFQHKNLAGTPD